METVTLNYIRKTANGFYTKRHGEIKAENVLSINEHNQLVLTEEFYNSLTSNFEVVKEKKSVAEMRGDYMDRNNLEFDLRTKKYYSIVK